MKTTVRGTALLAAVCVLAIGVLLGLTFAPARAPGTGEDVERPTTVPLSTEHLDDAREVTLEVGVASDLQVVSRATGVVTAYACSPGATIASGASPLSVDGEPVIALATSVPPWRDFVAGMAGPDVEALQEELHRLGHTVEANGRYDPPTRAAARELLDAHGARATGDPLQLVSIAWIRAPEVLVSACETQLGSTIGAGTAVALVAGEVESARISPMPEDLIPGDRQLAVGELTVPVEATGTVTDQQALEDLAASDAFAVHRESEGQVPLRGMYRLAEPLTVTSVPASAILAGAGETGCVVAPNGTVHRVQVVNSIAGRSLVLWPDDVAGRPPPVEVYLAPGAGHPCA